MRRASRSPTAPEQALALPELTTTPWRRSHSHSSRVTRTGAAAAVLRVNRPAEAQGSSETSTPRSRRLLAFRPAARPAARKPSGAVTL